MQQVSCTFSLIFSLLVDAGCSVRIMLSCDEDVRDVGEDSVRSRIGTALPKSLANA